MGSTLINEFALTGTKIKTPAANPTAQMATTMCQRLSFSAGVSDAIAVITVKSSDACNYILLCTYTSFITISTHPCITHRYLRCCAKIEVSIMRVN
jgi:hypothetical protein